STPMPRFVPHFGYVSLFPLFMQLFDPDDIMLSNQIDLLQKPDLLWSDYGLRSLANSSSFYMQYNTPDDPPYWRGSIWINMNFLALRSLYKYSKMDGPFQEKVQQAYSQLKLNLLRTVVSEYIRTGYIWEQYNDRTGRGKGSHPFTGWSALIILIGNDLY
ncbi:MAG: hypothetical protein MI674_02570, partial [Cytophagales bacterium]|nr:hypothetical protein [Cytophagales bacterium]